MSMNLRVVIIIASSALLFAWCSAVAQQSPSGPSVASSSANAKTEKPKHWSGSLVDVSCMSKALSQTEAPKSGSGPEGHLPHLLGSSFAAQTGQPPGGPIPAGQAGQAPGTPSTYPAPEGAQSPDMSPEQAEQIAKASKVDEAAKQCAAGPSTQAFGLAMSGGQVVKFNTDGNTKALEALKEVEVQPGKKVKAKVTGTMQDESTVKVASVEVKGKRAPGSQPSSSPGAGGQGKGE